MTPMQSNEQPPQAAGGAPVERRVRPDVERVDAVMRALYAMLRSAPNFDGRIGDVERAVWAAVEGARDAERERIKSALMRKHEDSKDRHNLYACLAVEWFGPNVTISGRQQHE